MALIVVMAANGLQSKDTAEQLGIGRVHVARSHPTLWAAACGLFIGMLLCPQWSLAALPELPAHIRNLGWAPSAAELALVDALPRPPALSAEQARQPCTPSAAAFSDDATRSAWTRRRPARVLTIWGMAHYGARVATGDGKLQCQDLAFLAGQWQAALGKPATGRLDSFEMAELARAISDIEWGRTPTFAGLAVGVGPEAAFTVGTTPPVAAAAALPAARPTPPSAAPAIQGNANAAASLHSPPATATRPSQRHNPQASEAPLAKREAERANGVHQPSASEARLALACEHADRNDRLKVCEDAIATGELRGLNLSRANYLVAIDLLFARRYDEAIDRASKSIQIDDSGMAYTLRGTVFREQRNFGSARADYERALQVLGKEPHLLSLVYANYAILKVNMGDPHGAWQDNETALTLDPKNETALRNRIAIGQRVR